MNCWLLRSEPKEYSWGDICNDQETSWDGVKNYQAINNMKKMKLGDLAFFYHSNTGKEIMGIVQVSKEFYPHEQFGGLVNISFHSHIKHSVTLKEIKTH